MRVLHLPTNIASIPSYTVRGLRAIGVEARGLVVGNYVSQSTGGLNVIDPGGDRRGSPLWLWRKVTRSYEFLRWVAWADVIHWYYDSAMLPFGLDLKVISLSHKPAVVEWLGSDIRIPEIEFKDNPYYKRVFDKGYEHQTESYKRSRETQERFSKAGFLPIVIPCMMQYIQKDIYAHFYRIGRPLMLNDFSPCYVDPNKTKPLIVHAPSAPGVKGTPYVLEALEQLKKKYEFDFVLVQGMSRLKALRIIQEADIYLDQFIVGYYGMAALEAMAYGKPVVCYVKPSLLAVEPPDLPIVNANPDNLEEVLAPLLREGGLRHEIGKRSRVHVEEYHDAIKLAYPLVEIYREVIQEKKSCRHLGT